MLRACVFRNIETMTAAGLIGKVILLSTRLCAEEYL